MPFLVFSDVGCPRKFIRARAGITPSLALKGIPAASLSQTDEGSRPGRCGKEDHSAGPPLKIGATLPISVAPSTGGGLQGRSPKVALHGNFVSVEENCVLPAATRAAPPNVVIIRDMGRIEEVRMLSEVRFGSIHGRRPGIEDRANSLCENREGLAAFYDRVRGDFALSHISYPSVIPIVGHYTDGHRRSDGWHSIGRHLFSSECLGSGSGSRLV
jgi:hypothetical protein